MEMRVPGDFTLILDSHGWRNFACSALCYLSLSFRMEISDDRFLEAL
jgi:hypothetical protein